MEQEENLIYFVTGNNNKFNEVVRTFQQEDLNYRLEQSKLETEEIKITVKSILPEKLAELKIKDIAGPVELPEPDRSWIWRLAVGISLAICLGGFLVYRFRKKKKIESVLRIPAHELAYRQLEELLKKRLIEDGRIKAFYFYLSEIVNSPEINKVNN